MQGGPREQAPRTAPEDGSQAWCPPRQCCRDSLAAPIFPRFLLLGARDGCSRTDGQSSLGVDHADRRSTGKEPKPRHRLDGRVAVLSMFQM